MNNPQSDGLSQLQKAAEIVGELSKSFSQEVADTQEEIIQQDAMSKLFKNPAKALLEEDVISKSPQSILCLAAYIAEFAEGVTNALEVLSKKVDYLLSSNLKASDSVVKGVSEAVEIVKATRDPQQVQFASSRHMPNLTPSQLEKANEGPSKGYVISKLEEMIEKGTAMLSDMTVFENSGRLRPEIEQAILASFRSDKVNLK